MFAAQTQQQIDLPARSRPAFVSWQAGGRQEFPNDPIADAVRTRRASAAGLIKTRRIPRSQLNQEAA
jgi:hypothetical protein